MIEEYVRPARVIEHGRVVTKPALSEPELIDSPRVGTLEAFKTDGLRTLLTTVDIANMKEKTLRYPGHCALMRVLRETGFTHACTTNARTVGPQDDPLQLPRFVVEDWDGEEFSKRLRGWFCP